MGGYGVSGCQVKPKSGLQWVFEAQKMVGKMKNNLIIEAKTQKQKKD